MAEPIAVTKEHQTEVCRLGQGELCCSYLGFTPGVGMACLKASQFEEMISKRREAKSMAAMGDNCSGPPDFEPTEISRAV